MLDGVLHAGDDGRAQAELARAVETVKRGFSAARSSHHWPVPSGELSSITRMSTCGACCKDVIDQSRQVLDFVVGGDGDERAVFCQRVRLAWFRAGAGSSSYRQLRGVT